MSQFECHFVIRFVQKRRSIELRFVFIDRSDVIVRSFDHMCVYVLIAHLITTQLINQQL